MSVTGLGADVVPYYLSEEQGWELQVEELHRALESAKGVCNPVALYVVNPGNPDGSKISPELSSSKFIFFCKEYHIVVSVQHLPYRSRSKQEIDARGDPVCFREEALPPG